MSCVCDRLLRRRQPMKPSTARPVAKREKVSFLNITTPAKRSTGRTPHSLPPDKGTHLIARAYSLMAGAKPEAGSTPRVRGAAPPPPGPGPGRVRSQAGGIGWWNGC